MNNSPGTPAAVSVSLNQASANIATGATIQFAATVVNSTNTAVTWSVDRVAGGNSTVGTITASGLYTAPSQTGSHTVTAASVADASATANASVAVGLVSVTPPSTMMVPGGTQQFKATIQGFTNTSVTWLVDQVSGGNSAVGTITAAGMYTAPSQAGTHTVTAASVADASAIAKATVTVVSITVSPTSAVLAPAGTEQFTATLPGGSSGSVTWSVDLVSGGNASVGTITAGGLYTAPPQPGSHTITATSAANASLSASATIAIITIAVSPTSVMLAGSSGEQFTATIQGPANDSITWLVDRVAGGSPAAGTISPTGFYTAAAQAGSHTITAASALNASVAASATVSVFAFRVSPAAVTVAPSGNQQFTASIQGLSPGTVTWSVDGIAGGNASTGTISASGLYSAPSTIGAHTITATSTADTAASVLASLTVINASQAAVLTYHNDDARDGAYLEELTLTPANVNSTQFGKLLAYPVDGQIYAQPLYLSQVNIKGGRHDVVYVVTENNSVYAFDADGTAAQPTTFWHDNFGPPVPAHDSGGPWPQVGILSTPVIDASTNIMYLVVESSNTGTNGSPFYLYALDVTTGVERIPHVSINATDSSSGETLEPFCYQRMALALNPVTNWIYVAFGSCTHGWLLAYDKNTLGQKAVFNATPGAAGGGLWASGGAPAIDDTTGNVYLMTGTDYDDAWISKPPAFQQVGYNDAFLYLDPTSLAVKSSFSPDNNYTLSQFDVDLGSGGNALVPGNSQHPLELIGGGKDGNIFVVDPLNMGGFNATNDNLQTVQTGTQQYNNIFSTPVYWNGTVYYHCNADVLRAFSWSASGAAGQQLSTQPTSMGSAVFGMHGATASLSAHGASDGIIWDIDNSAYLGDNPGASGPSVLHAYDAANVATELYNSSLVSSRDTAGVALKFTVPTIANGRVFVPTATELDVYGVLAP